MSCAYERYTGCWDLDRAGHGLSAPRAARPRGMAPGLAPDVPWGRPGPGGLSTRTGLQRPVRAPGANARRAWLRPASRSSLSADGLPRRQPRRAHSHGRRSGTEHVLPALRVCPALHVRTFHAYVIRKCLCRMYFLETLAEQRRALQDKLGVRPAKTCVPRGALGSETEIQTRHPCRQGTPDRRPASRDRALTAAASAGPGFTGPQAPRGPRVDEVPG